jgi:hypothetical protein
VIAETIESLKARWEKAVQEEAEASAEFFVAATRGQSFFDPEVQRRLTAAQAEKRAVVAELSKLGESVDE